MSYIPDIQHHIESWIICTLLGRRPHRKCVQIKIFKKHYFKTKMYMQKIQVSFSSSEIIQYDNEQTIDYMPIYDQFL